MTPDLSQWTIVHADPSLIAAHRRQLVVLSWRPGVVVDHIGVVAELERRLVREGHAPMSVMNVYTPDAAVSIGDDVRSEGRTLYKEMRPHFFAQAHVVRGGGFRAAGVRALVGAFTSLMSSNVTNKTFSTVAAGVRWLAELPGQEFWLATDVRTLLPEIEKGVLSKHDSDGAQQAAPHPEVKPAGASKVRETVELGPASDALRRIRERSTSELRAEKPPRARASPQAKFDWETAPPPAQASADPSPAPSEEAVRPAPCRFVDRCPMFARFEQRAPLRVFQRLYCDGGFERCARYALADRGKMPPPDLLPDGTLLPG